MRTDFFRFPRGAEVEFILTRNRIFDNLVLTGKIDHYIKKPGWQTVRQGNQVKNYPVNLVYIRVNAEKLFTVDVDCIKTRPTQEMVDKVNERAEKAIMDKEKPVEKRRETPKKPAGSFMLRRAPAFKMRDAIGKAIAWTYIASKNSKKFHEIGSTTAKRIIPENAVKFHTKKQAESSGRTYAGK